MAAAFSTPFRHWTPGGKKEREIVSMKSRLFESKRLKKKKKEKRWLILDLYPPTLGYSKRSIRFDSWKGGAWNSKLDEKYFGKIVFRDSVLLTSFFPLSCWYIWHLRFMKFYGIDFILSPDSALPIFYSLFRSPPLRRFKFIISLLNFTLASLNFQSSPFILHLCCYIVIILIIIKFHDK